MKVLLLIVAGIVIGVFAVICILSFMAISAFNK